MGKKKYALVLGGGGGKGSYEVGVWKALERLGYADRFSCVIGTSVGSLNAAFFAQGRLKQAEELWGLITQKKIAPLSPRKKAISTQRGIRRLLEKELGSFDNCMDAYVCTAKVTQGGIPMINEDYEPECVRLNELDRKTIINALLASSALPFVYEARRIEGQQYRDGGLIGENNVPYKLAFKMGYDRVLAISLGNRRVTSEASGDAQALVLCSVAPLWYSVFPKPGGVNELLGGTLDFDPEHARWRIDAGYRDIMDVYHKIYLEDFFSET